MGICSAVTSSVVSRRLAARNIQHGTIKKVMHEEWNFIKSLFVFKTNKYIIFQFSLKLNITGWLRLLSILGGFIREWLLLQRPFKEKFLKWKWLFTIEVKIRFWRLSEVNQLHGESVLEEGYLCQGTGGVLGLARSWLLASDRYEGSMRTVIVQILIESCLAFKVFYILCSTFVTRFDFVIHF